jgi:hypothetical protein
MGQGPESDVNADQRVARSRDTGGRTPDGEPDEHSTTGTSENDTYVGRVSGDEAGAEGQSGAEARAEAQNDSTA